ncbi:aldehyde oxidase GLOX [Artemisia annua]|uniref:Aldehyde oxidase GLOX n=1 Tax=Artemisia annua TaxID=35608 RepID=A0A2U1L1J0_ARTAN|nr:aldehyde oxidase GLOX [Artemisia annua]
MWSDRKTAKNPVWEMEEMPAGRIMGEMVMLPTCDVLIINGAQVGTTNSGSAPMCTIGLEPEHAPTPNLEKASVVFLPSFHGDEPVKMPNGLQAVVTSQQVEIAPLSF